MRDVMLIIRALSQFYPLVTETVSLNLPSPPLVTFGQAKLGCHGQGDCCVVMIIQFLFWNLKYYQHLPPGGNRGANGFC